MVRGVTRSKTRSTATTLRARLVFSRAYRCSVLDAANRAPCGGERNREKESLARSRRPFCPLRTHSATSVPRWREQREARGREMLRLENRGWVGRRRMYMQRESRVFNLHARYTHPCVNIYTRAQERTPNRGFLDERVNFSKEASEIKTFFLVRLKSWICLQGANYSRRQRHLSPRDSTPLKFRS